MKLKVEIPNYISLEVLRENREIGNRSYNALLTQGIYTVQDIINYYKKHNTFLDIKNIGELSNKELEEVVRRYNLIPIDLPFSLNEQQTKYFEEYVDFVYSKYENTNLKKLIDFSKRDYISVIEMLTDLEEDVRKTGNRSIIMNFYAIKHFILNFVNSIKDVIDKWSLVLILVQAGYYFLGYEYKNITLDKISKPFKFIFDTIYTEKKFDEREKTIIRYCYYFEEKRNKTDGYSSCLQELSKKIGLSSERVRQIRDELFDRIIDFLKVSKLLKDVIIDKYKFDIAADIVFVSRDEAEKISEIEGSDVSHLFYQLVLFSLLKNTHELIGIVRYTLFQHNIFFKHTSLYTIKRDLTEVFDFNELIKKVSLRYKSAVRRDEIFDLEEYIKPFFKKDVNEETKQRIYKVVKEILENDYAIKVDLENYKITFKRTSKETLQEVVYKVLKEFGRPMKIDEIYEELKKIRTKISKDSIRSTIVTDKERFVSFNRNSTYAVKEIVDGENIKAGTIRSIAKEFLERYDTPQTIDDVVAYVQKYRKASRSSIMSNIKLDSSHIFIFYKDKTMGLSSKPYYKPYDENLIPTRWEKNYALLLEFMEKNGRYPRLNFQDQEELLLYKFCRLNALLYSRKKMHDYIYNKMKEINFDFDISHWPYLKELKKDNKS